MIKKLDLLILILSLRDCSIWHILRYYHYDYYEDS